MISNGENWHYLVVKSLSGLLKGMASSHNEDFYCLNCFCAYNTKNRFEQHKQICENNKYCHVEMPSEDNKIIKYNHGEKSIKSSFIIYADLEYLLEKMDTCYNNTNESSTTEINKHTPSGYSLFTHCSFDKTKNKLDYYRGKEEIYHNKQKFCDICKKEFDFSNKNHHKVRDHCHYTGEYRGAAHNICNLRYKTPKGISIVFHNGSTYDYHFIIKESVKQFKENFECLGENTEKYITFSAPLKKKIENKNIEITYKIKFIDSYRFMSTSLSKLVDNLSEGHYINKCFDCKFNLDYIKYKNEKLIFKCFNCKQKYGKYFNKELIKRFPNTYEFCNKILINPFVTKKRCLFV